MNTEQLPHQLKSIIDSLLNKNDNVYIRANYRLRLDSIRAEIDKAIRSFDMEINMADISRQKKKR